MLFASAKPANLTRPHRVSHDEQLETRNLPPPHIQPTMNARRPKPRKIPAASESEDEAPKVIRPKKPTKLTPVAAASKPKKPLRLSFAPGAAAAAEDDEEEPAFVPKKSLLSQKATARNAARRELPMDVTPRQEQVSYSSEYLAALKAEQNEGGPKEGDVITITDDVDSDISMREVAVYDPTPAAAIPDAAMVRHLKQRRAERKGMPAAAQEENFISLGGGAKKDGGRLQPVEDDDELATFIEDAEKPILSNTRRARREAEEQRRKMIAQAIAGSSESESSSGEEEFADGQIRAGAGGQRKGFDELMEEMPGPGSVPGIEEVVRRLGGLLGEVQGGRTRVQGMLEEVGREKKEIAEREGVLKERLNEAGVAYERLKGEMGLGGMQEEEAGVVKPRGLESFGTPIRGSLGGTPIRGE